MTMPAASGQSLVIFAARIGASAETARLLARRTACLATWVVIGISRLPPGQRPDSSRPLRSHVEHVLTQIAPIPPPYIPGGCGPEIPAERVRDNLTVPQ